ncbi:MAG TPA: cation:proton antiporter [Bryobacteraceae bacterium]|nr:cation:proton antiporter [Bryobacteraceae bacterium]
MGIPFDAGAILLLLAAVVAIVTRRLRLPYSAGLVAAGMVLALFTFAPQVRLTKTLLFTALLPPLVFEAAFNIDWKRLRSDFALLAVLATVGLSISAAVTAAGMHYLVGWQWLSCTAFGVLIAATDPVSVIAIFREAGARGRLLLLVESESLLNDGTAAVAFSVVVALATGAGVSGLGVVRMLVLMIGGGVLCGGLVAGVALLLAGRTQDHLVEITMTTVAAYGSFLLADRLNLSGVLATLTAGLVMGNNAEGIFSARGRESLMAFWEYAAFVANSLIFLLIGIRTGHSHILLFWFPAAMAILLVTLGRATAIYPCCALFWRSRQRVPLSNRHVLFWGGLRGALALALALGLPAEVPAREQVITVTFAVAAFSILVQGLTMRPLLRLLGEVSPTGPAAE